MASIKLKFKALSAKSGKGSLYYQIIHQRKVKWIKTGYVLYTWEWDEKKESVVIPASYDDRFLQIVSIKKGVEHGIKTISAIINDLELAKHTYSVNDVVMAFNHTSKCESSVFNYCRDHIARMKQLGRLSTANNHNSALVRFINFREHKDLNFSVLSPEIIEDFEAYLKARGNIRNTVSFYMRSLRSMFNKASECGMPVHPRLFGHVYTGVDTTVKRAISVDDIRKIARLDLSDKPMLQKARDLFMFSFFTCGMAFVDMAYLCKNNISGSMLYYRRRKSGSPIIIKWEKEMQEIVDKHGNSTKYLLPIITDEGVDEHRQYKNALMLINRKLKKIGEMANLSSPLSMYVARHSWATIARDNNIAISVISEALGHNNETNTRIYLAGIRTGEVCKANRKIMRMLLRN